MLDELLNAASQLRPLGVPANLRNTGLICFGESLPGLERALNNYPWLRLALLIVADMDVKALEQISITKNGKNIPVATCEALREHPELEWVFLCPENPVNCAVFLGRLAIYAANFGLQTFYLTGENAPEHSLRQARPDFFHKHTKELETAFTLFADERSRATFVGRLKAILTGNASFIPIAPHSEYFHPMVHPEEGDLLLDGGISDMVQIQRQFIGAVGPRGHIFGFEPIESMARKAAKALRDFPSYHVQCRGLGAETGQAFFEDLRDSSHIISEAKGKNALRCELVSIDDFCRANHLGPVSCIKLDVEGSELDALAGAAATIKKDRPRLIICAYHKPEDLYEIPFLIKNLVPEYKLYLAHSSSGFTDTILYATVG